MAKSPESCKVAELCDILMLNRYRGWYDTEGQIEPSPANRTVLMLSKALQINWLPIQVQMAIMDLYFTEAKAFPAAIFLPILPQSVYHT